MAQSSQVPNPAEAYERFIGQGLFAPWTADLVERAAPKSGARVLDLACGTGIVTRQVAPLVGLNGSVTGLDISPDMLAVARTVSIPGEAKVEWHEGSGVAMPFPDSSFDLVLCQQGLQFFPDHLAGLKEVYRVLKPGGRVVISVWRGLDEQPLIQALDKVVSAHLAPGAFVAPVSLGDEARLEKLAREADFSKVDIQYKKLTIRLREHEVFLQMIMQGAAAVLPVFTALSPEERQKVIEGMKSDLAKAVKPFIEGEEMVYEGAANILTARR